jgi:serine/threonine protein kinase/tetratricopeptide (TPR) repeat protein
VLTQQQVGRFEIRDWIGRGAMGDVHLAWDPQRNAEVALKLIRTRRADPEMLEAEKNGAALQQQLAQVAPQVAAVYEQGQNDPFYWVAMEYVAGTDLSEILDQGPLTETRAALIALQLCNLLEVSHQFAAEIAGRRILGIVHGDIKPENIRLQEGDRVRILDFGIAKHVSQTRKFTVNLFGSLPYTPPERLERGVVDYHSDLWAVGVVLYMMVSGEAPYTGRDPEELEGRIRRGEPPMPLPASVSPGLRRIIHCCLAFDPAKRYPTAMALRADLEAWLEGRPLAGQSAGPEQEARDNLNATRRTGRAEPVPPIPGSPALDATRRTDRPATVLDFPERNPELGATRRTGEPGLPPIPPPPHGAAIPPPLPIGATGPLGGAVGTTGAIGAIGAGFSEAPAAELAKEPRRRRRRWPIVLLGLLLIALGVSQYHVRGEAAAIQRALVAQPNPDMDALLARYQEAARWSPLGLGLGAARDELREALIREADEILSSYHGDNPRTTERGWQRARDYLRAALDIQFRDKETRARMVYAQAHLDRIESQTLRAKGESDQARAKIDEAISGFRDAARRDSQWPDPFLGLARIYAYERFNLEELQKVLGELGKRGYTLGRREKAMLADGFRMRGIELHERAKRTREIDDQLTVLDQAQRSLEQAVDFYDDIPSYANVRQNRAEAERRLGEIGARLDAVHKPGVLERLLGIIDEVEGVDVRINDGGQS